MKKELLFVSNKKSSIVKNWKIMKDNRKRVIQAMNKK